MLGGCGLWGRWDDRLGQPPARIGCSLCAVPALTGVLLHALVDEVVDATLELAAHLLERLPKDVAALKRAGALLVGVGTHRAPSLQGRFDAPSDEVAYGRDRLRFFFGRARALRNIALPAALVGCIALW